MLSTSMLLTRYGELAAGRIARAWAALLQCICPSCCPMFDTSDDTQRQLRAPLVTAASASVPRTMPLAPPSGQNEVRLINAILQSILPLVRLQISRELVIASARGGIPVGKPGQPPLFNIILRPPAQSTLTCLQPEDVIENLRVHVLTAHLRNMVARTVSVRRWLNPSRAQPRHKHAVVRLQRAFRRSAGAKELEQNLLHGALAHATSSTNQKLCIDLQARIYLEIACDGAGGVPNVEVVALRGEGLPECIPPDFTPAQAVLRHFDLEAGLRVWWDMLSLKLDVAFMSPPRIHWDLNLAVGGVTLPNQLDGVLRHVVSLFLGGIGPHNPLHFELSQDVRENFGLQHMLTRNLDVEASEHADEPGGGAPGDSELAGASAGPRHSQRQHRPSRSSHLPP